MLGRPGHCAVENLKHQEVKVKVKRWKSESENGNACWVDRGNALLRTNKMRKWLIAIRKIWRGIPYVRTTWSCGQLWVHNCQICLSSCLVFHANANNVKHRTYLIGEKPILASEWEALNDSAGEILESLGGEAAVERLKHQKVKIRSESEKVKKWKWICSPRSTRTTWRRPSPAGQPRTRQGPSSAGRPVDPWMRKCKSQ